MARLALPALLAPRPFTLLVAFGALGLLGACAEEPAQVEDDLVGGNLVPEGQFPSTLIIAGNCTVSKVGPRHILSAAHCVNDQSIKGLSSAFQPGATIWVNDKHQVDNTIDRAKAGYRPVVIEAVHIPPAWFEEMDGANITVLTFEAPPDVAIIELTEESAKAIADIPESSVDLTPVAVGDGITIMGYGCEAGVNAAKDYSHVQLKAKKTKAIGEASLVHDGTFGVLHDPMYRERLERSYLFTPGGRNDPEQASLCPGDSGGPVYRNDDAQRTIVGVNAYYSFNFTGDSAGVSMTNWHTRLDSASRSDIGSWLTTLGVNVLGTDTHPERFGACEKPEVTGPALCGRFAEHFRDIGVEAYGRPRTSARLEKSADGAWRWAQKLEFAVFEYHPEIEAPFDVRVVSTDTVDPCATATGDGWYCGSSLFGGDPDSLYLCAGGMSQHGESCPDGCQASAPGTDDTCVELQQDPCAQASSGDGLYCGSGLGDPDPKTIYHCKDKVTFAKSVCEGDCIVAPPGEPDACPSSGG